VQHELPAIDQAAISAAGYADDEGWLVPAGRRLSAHVIGEDEDSSLTSAPSNFEDQDADGAVDNYKPLRLDEGNLADTRKASPKPQQSAPQQSASQQSASQQPACILQECIHSGTPLTDVHLTEVYL